MEEINIRELFQMILRRWWIIAAAFLAAVVFSAVLSFFILDPLYQSNTTIYIGKNDENNTNAAIAYNDILLNDRLVKDYRELIMSRRITERVITELGLKDMTPATLAPKISVNSKQDTRFIAISVEDENPELARTIADKIAEVFQQQVVEIMKVENVQIIDSAELPKSPMKPNKKMNLAIGGVLGIMLGLGVIFLVEYLDNTIKTPEDIKKYLDLPVIGTIPVFPEQST